jgi:hypothetical protein
MSTDFFASPPLSDFLVLPASEVHNGSLCVAITNGLVSGILVFVIITMIAEQPLPKLLQSVGLQITLVVIASFCINWFICEHFFSTAHAWYGAGTFYHRMYDFVGIVVAVVAFLLLKYVSHTCQTKF